MNLGWIELVTTNLLSTSWLARLAGGWAGLASAPTDHVRQHELFTIPADLGFLTPDGEITVLSDIIVMTIVASVLLMIFIPFGIKKRKGEGEIEGRVPRGPGTALEVICWFWRDYVARPLLGPHTDRFIGFIWTVFFFILTINLLGLLPFGSLSSLFGTHIGGTATANLWVTATLALVTLVLMVVNGLRLGGTDYLAHFNPTPKDLPLVGRILMSLLLIPVEIAGTFFKIFALAIRLFANMVAGHILLAVLLSFITGVGAAAATAGAWAKVGAGGVTLVIILGTIGITVLEVLVALIQAFIFTFLTILFLGQSVLLHHEDEHPVPES